MPKNLRSLLCSKNVPFLIKIEGGENKLEKSHGKFRKKNENLE